MVRTVSVQAGDMVGFCRNPADIGYVKENAAIGGITQAIELRKVLFSVFEVPKRIEVVGAFLNGRIIHAGKFSHFKINATRRFDIRIVQIADLELTFWNEYMTAEMNGERKVTFPNFIITFDAESGLPIVSVEIEKGVNVAVISVPKENLKLSSTMFNEKLLKAIEPIIQKKIV